MHKKGQSEDIFNDLIPAVILIIATIVIIAINGLYEERNISGISESDLASLRRIDLVTYMRMPVKDYGSFSELIMGLSAGDDMSIALTNSVDPYKCSDELAAVLRKNIGKNYGQWSLRAFNRVSGEIFFECYSDDDFFIDAYRLASVDYQELQYGSNMNLDFEQAYFSPLGMQYINVTLPSSDPNQNMFVKMGMMPDE